MSQATQENNKALVLEAFDTLFNRATTRRPSGSGRPATSNKALHRTRSQGLFNLVRSLPSTPSMSLALSWRTGTS